MPKTLALNATTIKGLPTPEEGKRVRYYDSRAVGLTLLVSWTGRKDWYYYRKVKGKPAQKKIGEFPSMGVDEAREIVELMNGNRSQGKPVTAPQASRGEQTFAGLYAWYLENHAKPRKKELSWKNDEQLYRTHLAKTLGPMPLSFITRARVREVHAAIGKSEKHSKSGQYAANRVLSLVSTVFSRAIAHEVYDGINPAQGIEKFREVARTRRLMHHEVESLLGVLERETPLIRDFFMLAILTGARKSDLRTLKWEHVNLDVGILHLPLTKNGLPQDIPLGEHELRILKGREELAGGSPWVFPSNRAPDERPFKTVDANWKRIRAKAGVDDLRVHDLRRTLGSWMADTGASLPTIGKTLNHQSPSATAVYARLSDAPVREAKAKAHDALLGARKTS